MAEYPEDRMDDRERLEHALVARYGRVPARDRLRLTEREEGDEE